MFLECLAYMDNLGGARCGLPAEIEHRYSVRSTDGALEGAKIRCPPAGAERREHGLRALLDGLTTRTDIGRLAGTVTL